MNKVKSRNYGIIHVIVQCDNCDWSYEDYTNINKTTNEIRKHVKETGHIVQLETGSARKYYLEK